MRKQIIGFILGAALAAIPLTGAMAQAVTLPQVQQINPGDLFQDQPNGQVTTGNVYAPASLFGSTFGIGTPSRGNALVGADATTNTWVHGTAGAATTSTTPTYKAPTMWAQWSTASSSVTLSQDSTAADLPSGYQYAFELAHTNTTAGTICMAQEIESVASYQFQGQTAELDFHAATGAGFSASGSTMTASIVYGTGQNQGIASLEAGTWTGQANATAAVVSLGGVSTIARYAAIGSIPLTATEVAVKLCYAAGTTDTNDYIAFSGIQLIRNPANTAFVNTGVGYKSGSTANLTLASFDREPPSVATVRQQRFAYSIADNQAATTYVYAMGQNLTTTSSVFLVPFPVTMWENPTGTASASTAFGDTATAGGVTACGSTDFSVVSAAATPNVGKVACSSGATGIAGGATQLVSENTGATVVWSAEF